MAKLVGRGGAGFPVATKWEAVKRVKSSQKAVVCNASEGELGVFKDLYILEHHADKVVEGMVLAMDFLGSNEAFFNINKHYYKKIGRRLKKVTSTYEKKGYKFTFFIETPSYIGGEETALLNAIEGKRIEPRHKPPFPVESGLYGKPTLIHNVETLFNVAMVNEGNYDFKRFYCISGLVKHPGVYHLGDHLTIHEILSQSDNLPTKKYFAQLGGSASGLVINEAQTKNHFMTGAGSLELYPSTLTPRALLTRWFKFYAEESCGKCTPCREGSFQLYKMIKKGGNIPWKAIMEIVHSMEKTSFCALGKSIFVPVISYRVNVLKHKL